MSSTSFTTATPTVFPTETFLPFPNFETGFTPWEDCEDLYTSYSTAITAQSPKPAGSSSGSDEPARNQTNSNSDDQTRPVSVMDERKRRRMLSNRESARRSRMRKQKHLENLRNQVNRLRLENRELNNRLQFVMYHCRRVCNENETLRSEHSFLRRKLSEIRQILIFRQLQQPHYFNSSAWPCNSEQTPQPPQSLIA